ncbi:hypothetical protein N234_07875 [Ralstonia pickettii DTP0602]|nr:hypothetical protein N234_07875 [Ralstonia pickettii DTP0602]
MKLKTILNTIAMLGICSFCGIVQAQSAYPAKPISLVVGYPPGGSSDVAARALAQALSTSLGATVVVENIGGATGAIAAQKVARAAPDGYTLLLGSTNELVATRLFNPQQAYDGSKDFTYIGVVEHQGAMILASPKSGIRTTDDLIKRMRSAPGALSYGTSGIGSMLHYAMESLMQRTNTRMTHVPYRGVAPLGTDLAGNNLEVGVMGIASAKALIDAGKVVPIAVTTKERSAKFPNVPTVAEHPLLKGYDVTGWFVLAGPKNLPAPVVGKLKSTLQSALHSPQFRRHLDDAIGVPARDDEDALELIKMETQRYKSIVSN